MKYYSAALTLILVMDPLGNIPIFLSILQRFTRRQQLYIILRECFFAFLILVLFLFFGQYILQGLGISASALNVAGGIILFLIALNMIFPSKIKVLSDDHQEDPFIVPLAIPLIAGPSSLATVLLLATKNPELIWSWFLAVVIATSVFTLFMLTSPLLMRMLGRRGIMATERLMGMILTTISVQMFLSGIHEYFLTLPASP